MSFQVPFISSSSIGWTIHSGNRRGTYKWGFAAFAFIAVLASLATAQNPASAEYTIDIKAAAGLRFDPVRFRVPPGAKVSLRLENGDDMPHNLLITKPGVRMEVVNAALLMPVTATQDFVPRTGNVLFHTPVLLPGQSHTLVFTAPELEGVYPYVCTYPGHGLLMFGAMYVTNKELPPLQRDANVPDYAREQPATEPLHAYHPTRPYHYRIYMRDAGPAAIAVMLPGDQNYCWDAGACRLRYAWRGPGIDPLPHWRNGSAFAEIKGTVYYRAPAGFPLRLGSPDNVPRVKFRGYRLVKGYPEFRYEIDGVDVSEVIKPSHHGSGIVSTFTIAQASAPVFYVTDPEAGAAFSSSAGIFRGGVLELKAEQAKSFSITLTEIRGREPVGYWSMNDVLFDRTLPVGGVVRRALPFDGSKSQFKTGVSTADLSSDATFALWVRLSDPAAREQAILGGRSGEHRFAVGYNLGGSGFGFLSENGDHGARLHAGGSGDKEWRHLVVTISPRNVMLYIDGKVGGTSAGSSLPANASIYIGSLGGVNFFEGVLDEVRIYQRVLDAHEISRLYERERPKPAGRDES